MNLDPVALEKVERVLQSSESSITSLAELVGLSLGRDFAGSDLTDEVFANIELQSPNFNNTDFTNSSWTSCSISNARLNGTRFREASLADCLISNGILRRVSFSGAILRKNRFVQCRFIDCDFDCLSLASNTFSGCTFNGCWFSDPSILDWLSDSEVFNSRRIVVDGNDEAVIQGLVSLRELERLSFLLEAFLETGGLELFQNSRASLYYAMAQSGRSRFSIPEHVSRFFAVIKGKVNQLYDSTPHRDLRRRYAIAAVEDLAKAYLALCDYIASIGSLDTTANTDEVKKLTEITTDRFIQTTIDQTNVSLAETVRRSLNDARKADLRTLEDAELTSNSDILNEDLWIGGFHWLWPFAKSVFAEKLYPDRERVRTGFNAPVLFSVVWEEEVLSAGDYSRLVSALGDLCRSCGADGVRLLPPTFSPAEVYHYE